MEMLQTPHEYYSQQNIPKELCSILDAVLATSVLVAQKIHAAPYTNLLGSACKTNIQGEDVQKLDILTNDLFTQALQKTQCVAGIASEELDTFVAFENANDAPFIVTFDPLDGSSNIDVNGGIGTIFCIMQRPEHNAQLKEKDFLQGFSSIVASGYILYGPSTQAVLSCGAGTQLFSLTQHNTYTLITEQCSIPNTSVYLSANLSNMPQWNPALQKIIHELLPTKSLRYVGSLVADIHRTLLKGGIFLYPNATQQKKHEGKLRVLFEVFPIAFLMLQAQGTCFTQYGSIETLHPTSLHQRVALFCGSKDELALLLTAI